MGGGRHLAIGAMLLWAASAAHADDDSICASRPGQSTPPCTVPAGKFQVETGLADWSLQKDAGNRETSLAIGETTFMYGLSDRSDIEIDVTPWQRATSSGPGFADSVSGFGDITVGFKQQLTAPGAAVGVALLPVVKIPTAGHQLGNGKWEGGLLVPMSFSLGKSPFSIGLTPEVDWSANSDGNGHHATMVQVASLGWAVNDRLSLSAELWGQWDYNPAGTTRQATADGSIAYLVNNDLQLDAGGNFGLNRETPDVELYAGVSKRF
jgi:hypothetical protein